MKKVIILIFVFLCGFNISYATENEKDILQNEVDELEINNLIDDVENITDTNIDLHEIFNEALEGKSSQNIILKSLSLILGQELSESLKIIISILLIIIVHSILKNISENLGNDQVGKVGHFIQVIILITVLMKVYSEILTIVKETIETISSFIYVLFPLFISLSISTGNITSSTGVQSIILISTNLITVFINQVLIPIIVVATVIGIVSNISDEVHMNKLSKYMKSIVIWILGIFLTGFTCILAMESSLGNGVDQLTSKTTKTAVSSFVPVVGKILGDTVESVLSCTNIIKNAVGMLGAVGVIVIAMSPLIRIGITTIFLYLMAGLSETIADEKIVYVLEQMGDSCKVLLAAVASMVMMLIIGFTITMKIGVPL